MKTLVEKNYSIMDWYVLEKKNKRIDLFLFLLNAWNDLLSFIYDQ